MHLRVIAAIFFSVALASGAALPQWEKIDDCSYIPNQWNDGDSFHVRINGVESIIRLYFVDCPESDPRFPDRVAEQANYFGISSDESLALGKKAADYVGEKLSRGPFTIYTCWQKALGSSKLQRYYGFISVDGEWLDQLLIEKGLARIYGKRITPPDGMKSPFYREKLTAIELGAKLARQGGWSSYAPKPSDSN